MVTFKKFVSDLGDHCPTTCNRQVQSVFTTGGGVDGLVGVTLCKRVDEVGSSRGVPVQSGSPLLVPGDFRKVEVTDG